MDDLIVNFLEAHHPHEYQHEVYLSFKLLSGFEYPDIYSSFIDVLTNESYQSTEQTIDAFDITLHNQLDEVLKYHQIVLVDDATHIQKNALLSALLTLQTLDDHTSVLCVLESLETDEEQLSSILADYCDLDQTEILSIIADFNPIMLTCLKRYIQDKLSLAAETVPYQALLPRLKQFFTLYGKENIGYILIDQDVKPGYPLDMYLSLTENTFDKTAINITSLILLTLESQQSPIDLFHQYSERMVGDIRIIPSIEAEMLQILNTVDEHVRAHATGPRT